MSLKQLELQENPNQLLRMEGLGLALGDPAPTHPWRHPEALPSDAERVSISHGLEPSTPTSGHEHQTCKPWAHRGVGSWKKEG